MDNARLGGRGAYLGPDFAAAYLPRFPAMPPKRFTNDKSALGNPEAWTHLTSKCPGKMGEQVRDESSSREEVSKGAPSRAPALTRSVRERSQPRGCCEDWEARLRLVVGRSVRCPSVEVPTHRRQHDTKEPALTACDASVVKTEVEFFYV
jgi:hypothetical protein